MWEGRWSWMFYTLRKQPLFSLLPNKVIQETYKPSGVPFICEVACSKGSRRRQGFHNI